MPPATAAPLTLFISYSRQDEVFKEDLVVHLASLKREGKIQAWHNRDIEAGAEWDTAIKQHLESADVILLLISASYIASDDCYDQEMHRAIQRHNDGTARVIPIILKPCDWQGTPFGKLQVLPKDAIPVIQWGDRDTAFLNVVQGIRKAVESLSSGRKPCAPTDQSEIQNPKFKIGNPPPFSTYTPTTWVERTEINERLLAVLRGNCRILALVGITGIGKTALAERLVAELFNPTDTPVGAVSPKETLREREPPLPKRESPQPEPPQSDTKPFRRLNLDEGGITPDFASSGAALLRSLGDESTLEDQKDPQNLLNHILSVLKDRPVRLQIDSMERLLRGNDQEGWSEFCDPLWLNLFQRLLTAGDCQSQIILTTQDIPENLAYEGSRYEALWHCEPIRGLSETEQLELFAKRGIGIPPASSENLVGANGHSPNAEHQAIPTDSALGEQPSGGQPSTPTSDAPGSTQQTETLDYLKRIGRIYDGHPLVLRVIADDIKTCGGYVVRYWQQCRFDDLEAHKPTRFSRRKLQREVERRVKTALESLPPDALQLLCCASVYRRPVPRAFWLGLMPDLAPNQGDALLNLLESRGFATEVWEPGSWLGTDGEIPLRQHNLIRNVAYNLLQKNKSAWETAHRQAADLWLKVYEPVDDVPNLEKVRGYLEAFDHFYTSESYHQVCEILFEDVVTGEELHWQLFIWGYFKELIAIHSKIITITEKISNPLARSNSLGNLASIYRIFGNYQYSVSLYSESLEITRSTGNKDGESKILGNLGIIHRQLGEYSQALESYQKALGIAQEVGNRSWEGAVLGNIGNIYLELKDYDKAIDYFDRYLSISRETGFKQGEAISLGALGDVYCEIGDYHKAINLNHQKLEIAKQIGDKLTESYALSSLGKAQLRLGQYRSAISNLSLALEVCKIISNKYLSILVSKHLAELHQKLGERERAIFYCRQALAISTELGIPLKAECETLMEEIQKRGKGEKGKGEG